MFGLKQLFAPVKSLESDDVINVNGGIKAWQGIKAAGPVELNMDIIRGDETPEEILTQGLDLYLRFADKSTHSQTKEMLLKIADEEKSHLASLG
jgi:hypothetical protein